MKRKSVFIMYIIFIAFTLLMFFNVVNADINSIYDPITKPGSAEKIVFGSISTILGYLKWAGVVVGVGVLMYKGIRYVTMAPEGKAQIQKEMIIWAIGIAILLLFTTFIDIIYRAVQDIGWTPKA